jgi:hypothetical protein
VKAEPQAARAKIGRGMENLDRQSSLGRRGANRDSRNDFDWEVDEGREWMSKQSLRGF